jgi:hypothetical protein
VIELRFLDGLPPREVAKVLGVPVETVRTRTRRALSTMRARLDEEHGGDPSRWRSGMVVLAGLRSRELAAPGAAAGVPLLVALGGFVLILAVRGALVDADVAGARHATPAARESLDRATPELFGTADTHARAVLDPLASVPTPRVGATVEGVVLDSRGVP